MEIVWLGHSALKLRSHGVNLITDPFDSSLGFSMSRQRADIVTVSNSHPNHSQSEAVDGKPQVLNGPGEYEIAGFYITGVGTRLSDNGPERLINTVFIIRAEGLMLCHLGDLNQKLSPREVQQLRGTDVMFAPAGGGCTISTSEMAELINTVNPRIVVPVHYEDERAKVELGSLEGFLNEMGISGVEPRTKLQVNETNLPRELQVVALQPIR